MTAISSWKRGDYAVVARVTITDAGDPVDLTDGYDVVWQLRSTPNAGSFVAVEVDMVDADSGVLLGTIGRTASETMDPGVWVSDIQITKDDKPFSSETFEVEVLPDVSREVPV